MSTFKNDTPFNYLSRYGTKFTAARCDFQGGIDVSLIHANISEERLFSDIVEMATHHALIVYPNLNGFNGYGNIEYRINKK